MNLEILAQNIRRIRIAKGIRSQKDLADRSGLSLPSIKNLEGVKGQPRMRTLQAVARALEVKLQDLFLPVRQLQSVRFRSNKKMRSRENILAEVSRWLEDFNYLEALLNEQRTFQLEQTAKQCARSNPAEAAKFCRKELKLKQTEPIHDICGLLEHAGIKVYQLSVASADFFGLSVGKESGGPAIVVNIWDRIPVERQIFSAAHELGHLILHHSAYDVSKVTENKEEESEADHFAGHLLLPDQGFRKEWQEASGLHWVDRVLKVKRIFHVSYKTILMRLKEEGVVDNSIWKKFNYAYLQRYGRSINYKEEPQSIKAAVPHGFKSVDFYEDKFNWLVRQAVEDDKISLSRGAEILKISIEEMQNLLKDWEAVA